MRRSIIIVLFAMFISFAVSAPAFAATLTITNTVGTGGGTVNLYTTGGTFQIDSCAPTVAGCTFSQPVSTGFVITAFPDSASTFAGWNIAGGGGGCAGSGNSCTLTIAGNTTVDARFNAILPYCTYTISPTSASYTSAGGSNSISVTYNSAATCQLGTWTAVPNVPWITVTSGAAGNVSGAVNYTVAASTSLSSQTGTISVAGQTFTVTQSANASRQIKLSADSFNFGTVSMAPPSRTRLTISNAGSNSLVINSVVISGTNAGDFSALDECSTIPGGDSCPVTVLFSPSSAGAESATLTVNSSDTAIPAYSVTLSGTGSTTAAANISVTPSSIIYPSPLDLENDYVPPFTVTNTGTGTLLISSVNIEGRDAAEFSINNSCPVIAAAANCNSLSLQSNYTSSAAKQASLVISSNAAGAPKVEVPISAPALAINGGLPCDISTISLSGTSQSVNYGGANSTVTVNASSSCWWQPVSNNSWITITSGNVATMGNGTVGYSVGANIDNANILGNMTVAGKHFSVVQYGSSNNSIFSDNTNPSVSDYINALAARGIAHGCGNGNYECTGDNNVTREEMAAYVVRALEGEPPATYCSAGSPFSDVASGSTWCPYVKRLHELGITTGCTSSNYCPVTDVTRDQMAVYIIRALYGENFTCTGGVAGAAVPCATTAPYFNDVLPTDPVEGTYFPYIQKLYELGIIHGCGNNNYCPAGNVSRDNMAIFVGRSFLGMQ